MAPLRLVAMLVMAIALAETAAGLTFKSGENYYVKLEARPSTCRTGAEYLGFRNLTCKAGTVGPNKGKTAGPVLRDSNDGKQWKKWKMTVIDDKPASDGGVTVSFATYYPPSAKGGQPRCMGNMVVEKKKACSTEKLAASVHIHPKQPVPWRLVPVNGEKDTFNVIAADRPAGCLRYLGAAAQCTDSYARLYKGDAGTGLQRWVITPVNGIIDDAKVPVVNYSIAITGYNKDTFAAPQKTAFCDAIVASIEYPQYLLKCVVVFISNLPFDAAGRHLLEETAYVRGYTVFAVSSRDNSSLQAAEDAAMGLLNELNTPENVTTILGPSFPDSTVSTDKAELGLVPEPIIPAPPPPSQPPVSPSPSVSPTQSPSPSPTPIPVPVPSPPPPSADPATVPGRPSNAVGGAVGSTEATIEWNTPASNGGSPILSYRVACVSTSGGAPVGPQTFSAATACSGNVCSTGIGGFTGLQPSTIYTCAVVAVNDVGPSATSVPSEPFTTSGDVPASPPPPIGTPPGAPTNAAGYASSTSPYAATIFWDKPLNEGSSVIDSYVVTCLGSNSLVFQTFTAAAACQIVPPGRRLQVNIHDCTSGIDGIIGLFAGEAYTCFVAASSTAGIGDSSNICSFTTITPSPGTPGAPASLVASSPTSNTVTLTWTPPADIGDSPIIDYSATCTPTLGGSTVGPTPFGTALTGTFTGLSPLTAYSCIVVATNTQGPGTASDPAPFTTLVTPVVPGSPTSVLAIAVTSTTATITWTAPSSPGTAPIDYYDVTCIGSTSITQRFTTTTTGPGGFINLLPGQVYDCTVNAHNAVGNSPPSARYTFTSAIAPDPPTSVAAGTPTPSTVTLTWTLSADDGGSQITGYVSTCHIDTTPAGPDFSQTFPLGPGAGTGSPGVVGLTASTSYACTVAARNAVGDSVASNTVTFTTPGPTVPGPPTAVTADLVGASRVILSWTAPVETGGAPLLDYYVTCTDNTNPAIGPVAYSGTTTEPYGFSGLLPGTNYDCIVEASNIVGNSVASAIASFGTTTVLQREWRGGAVSQNKQILAATGTIFPPTGNSDSGIFLSTDAGMTWVQQSPPSAYYYGVSMSTDGSIIYAAQTTFGGGGVGGVWRYKDNVWTALTGFTGSTTSVACSSDGQHVVSGNTLNLYLSSDYGDTWTVQTGVPANGNFEEMAMSQDGTVAYASSQASGSETLWVLRNGAWSVATATASGETGRVAASSDGSKVLMGVYGKELSYSSDYGATWTTQTMPNDSSNQADWIDVAMSYDGDVLYGVSNPYNVDSDYYIYSQDSPTSAWAIQPSSEIPVPKSWYMISCSSDGEFVLAGQYRNFPTSGNLYIRPTLNAPYMLVL